MWLGTYQPVYTKKELLKRPDLDERSIIEGFDFQPVWCLPANDVHDLVVSSIFAAPRFPDAFYLFECDDEQVIRIDKAKWYAAINKDSRVTTDMYDHNVLPDVVCEFVIPKSLFNDKRINDCFIFPVFELIDIASSGKIHVHKQCDTQCYVSFLDYEDHMIDCVYRLYDRYKNCVINGFEGAGFTEEQMTYKYTVNIMKIVFERTVLPLMWAAATQESDYDIYGMDMMYSFCNSAIQRVYSDFYDWQASKSSEYTSDKFLEFANRVKQCCVSDYRVMDLLFDGIKIGRNEKCPCGSGKKFKQCCGRILD